MSFTHAHSRLLCSFDDFWGGLSVRLFLIEDNRVTLTVYGVGFDATIDGVGRSMRHSTLIAFFFSVFEY